MKNNRFGIIFVLLVIVLSLAGCQHTIEEQNAGESGEPSTSVVSTGTLDVSNGATRIIQISDPHFYSPRLHNGGELYTKVMSNAGGRDALHIEEIVDSFIDEMLQSKLDAVIVSGDLTLNGARASHEDFAAKLKLLEDAGIPVYVIPGNHDINNPNCFEIRDDGAYRTANVSPEEFEQIYKNFGYDEAVSRDQGSLSYVINLNDKVTLLMFDSCMYGDNYQVAGNLSYETRQWAYEETRKAKSEGREVISVTHQNLVSHNEMFDADYMIINSERFVEELIKLDVKVNLSGHMHSMHVSNADNRFFDVALGSLAVYPNYYGILEIEGKDYRFTTKPVEHESDSESYLRAASLSRTLLNDDATLRDDLSAEDKLVYDLVADMHVKYFAGEAIDKDTVKSTEAYALLNRNYGDTVMCYYINQIIETGTYSSRSFEIKGNKE